MTAFLDVVLHGAGLSSQAIAVGGVLFVLLVLRPAGVTAAEIAPLVGRSLTLVAGCAVGVAIAQCLSLVLQLGALASDDGLFEWMVRTGRLRSRCCALVFPLLCAVGSGLLLTHSHALDSLKTEFLVEVTHAPLAIVGMLVGWARWLELRLPPPDDRLPGRLWPAGLTLVGLLLLLYRES